MKKVQAFAATIMLAAVTFAFTTKPVATNADNPMLNIVEKTFHSAVSIVPTHDRNHDFLHIVEALHKGGMELARIQLAKGTDAEIKELAEAAVEVMRTDMTLISQYYKENQQKGDTKEKFHSEVLKALEEMHKKADNSHLNGNVDHDYTVLMQRVAEAEREVAKAYVRLGTDPKLEQLAQRLAAENKEEKKDLKEEHKSVK